MALAPPAASAESIPGLKLLGPREARLQRVVVLALTVGPFAGLVTAVALLWGGAVNVLDLGIFLITYVLFGLGITVGFHRMFTHGAFDASPRTRVVFAVLGSMAIEGSVISWVADHRRHHAYADKEGDPHSPHLQEQDGVAGVLKGLWHAHMGWFLSEERTDVRRWAPDLLKEPGIRKVERAFPLLATLSLVLPGVIGLVVTQSWQGAFTAFVWGGLARAFLLHHVTWSVNSICHYFGRRPYATSDLSTNNWPLAVISFGESWHNNHHAFPSAAFHG
ncbi:MAG: acyl-CoA desaturase, partial [Actinomycetota bacterium]